MQDKFSVIEKNLCKSFRERAHAIGPLLGESLDACVVHGLVDVHPCRFHVGGICMKKPGDKYRQTLLSLLFLS